MKRIRIAAALTFSAALMTISVGTQAASSDRPTDGEVMLPALICGGLDRLLSRSDFRGVGEAEAVTGIPDAHAGRVSINVEIVGPPPTWDDLSPWMSVHPPAVSLFSCWSVLIRSDSVSPSVSGRSP